MADARTSTGIVAKRAHSAEREPLRALAELRERLEPDGAGAVLLFCSEAYDLERLGVAIAQSFEAPVAACTAAGQIGAGGFERGGISGISLRGGELELQPLLLSPLAPSPTRAAELAHAQAALATARAGARSLAVLLVDGASLCEEYMAAALYEALGDVPLVGGSAAAATPERVPAVYFEGRFLTGAAVLALFRSATCAFTPLSVHHFVPSERKLVITLADPERRRVYELNGEPAAQAYADALGLVPAELQPRHFACHPLLLKLGDQLLPRAIRSRHADGSFSMGCTIEEGLVLSIAEGTDPLPALERAFEQAEQGLPAPSAYLVFDCVSRWQELEACGSSQRVGELLARRGAAGFSGWGAQLGPVHTNHTLTGVAFGARPGRLGR